MVLLTHNQSWWWRTVMLGLLPVMWHQRLATCSLLQIGTDCKSVLDCLWFLSAGRMKKRSSLGAAHLGHPLYGLSLTSPNVRNLALNFWMVLGLAPDNAATWFCRTPALSCPVVQTLSRSHVVCWLLEQTPLTTVSRRHDSCISLLECLLALAEKILQIFHRSNPHALVLFRLFHWCMFLSTVAPFKGEIIRLSNSVRFIAKMHCYKKEIMYQT